MRYTPIETKLNLPSVTSVLKALYHSNIPVHGSGTSLVKPSKLFLPLNMVLHTTKITRYYSNRRETNKTDTHRIVLVLS